MKQNTLHEGDAERHGYNADAGSMCEYSAKRPPLPGENVERVF